MNYDRLHFLLEQLREQGHDAFILYGIAMEYYDSDRVKAIEYLFQVRKSFPDYLPTYFKLGAALDEANEPEQALKILEEGILLARRTGDQKAERELNQYATNLRMELD